MSLLYYKQLIPEGDADQALQLQEYVKDALHPFQYYLEAAIESLRSKKVAAHWKHIDLEIVQLMPQMKWFRIKPHTCVQVFAGKGWYKVRDEEEIFETDYFEPIRVRKLKKQFEITSDDFQMNEEGIFIRLPLTEAFLGRVHWGFEAFELELAWVETGEVNTVTTYGEQLDFEFKDKQLFLDAFIQPSTQLLINGEDTGFRIIEQIDLYQYPDLQIVNFDLTEAVVCSHTIPKLPEHLATIEELAMDIRLENILNFDYEEVIDPNSLTFAIYKDSYREDALFHTVNGMELRLHKVEDHEQEAKDQFWIELDLVNESYKSDDDFAYFFDETIDSVMDEYGKVYNIVLRNEAERRIVLAEKSFMFLDEVVAPKYILPATELIFIHADSRPPEHQLEVMARLLAQPHAHLYPLMKIFEPIQEVQWEAFEEADIQTGKWLLLKNGKRKGCKAQRDFVKRALATPDFAFLEGAPGSGKTTVLLELIWQILQKAKASKQYPRILLCSATPQGADHLLRQIIQHPDFQKETFPLRVGELDRVDNDLRVFHWEAYTDEETSRPEQLILEAANLVVAPVKEMWEHPMMRQWLTTDTHQPLSPYFDYLIVDESNDITFQDFLLPAVFAKKWILAGDTMQLTPYTNRHSVERLIGNLRFSKMKGIPDALQKACFYLETLLKYSNTSIAGQEGVKQDFHNRFILPLPAEVLDAMVKEIGVRMEESDDDYNEFELVGKKWITISREKLKAKGWMQIFSPEALQENRLAAHIADFILLDESLTHEVLDLLPEYFIFLGKNWQYYKHGFRHLAFMRQASPDFATGIVSTDGTIINESLKIAQYIETILHRENWSRILSQAIIRQFELQFTSRADRNQRARQLKRRLHRLFPQSLNIAGKVIHISRMALPSLLESIHNGVIGRLRSKYTSTLTKGFADEILEGLRHSRLEVQHRMHPDITQLVSKVFYENTLKDVPALSNERDWDFDRHASRVTWLNTTEQEIPVLKEELQHFCDWANQQEGNYKVACLCFQPNQKRKLCLMVQDLCEDKTTKLLYQKGNVDIHVGTVETFQGQEADVVFLCLGNPQTAFPDSPNRLNLALSRAKYQLVIVGKQDTFGTQTISEEWRELVEYLQH